MLYGFYVCYVFIIMTSQKLCSSACWQSIAKFANNEDLLFNRIVVEHSGMVLWHVLCYIFYVFHMFC